MKRVFSAVIILAFLFNCITASAYEENTYETYTSGDYSYIFNDENGITIVSYNGEDSEVITPSEISGKTVTCIGSDSFSYSYNIEKLIISNGVTRIENFAFYDCENLKEISFPDSLIFIGEEAFAYCAIEEIVFPENLEYISGGAFDFCESLKKRRFESSETEYVFTAFKNTPFEESYKDDLFYHKADNSPLFIKKTMVFLKGLSLFAPFNGDIRYMSDAQAAVSVLVLSILVFFVLALFVTVFWLMNKAKKRIFGEASKRRYAKFNTAFIKEYENSNHNLGKYNKYTTFGERFLKKTKLVFWFGFWSLLILVSLGIGTYIQMTYYEENYVIIFPVLTLSIVIIPLAAGLLIVLLKLLVTVFVKIKYRIKSNLNNDEKAMRIVDVRKRGVKYE